MASVYQINKGVSRPMMFKGLKAQYIGYLAVGMVLLLIAFAVMYIARVNLYVVLVLVLGMGTGLVFLTSWLSHRFGEFGLMKFFAQRGVPRGIVFRSRGLFTGLAKGGRYGS
jgi:hypothetical protein